MDLQTIILRVVGGVLILLGIVGIVLSNCPDWVGWKALVIGLSITVLVLGALFEINPEAWVERAKTIRDKATRRP